MTTDKISHASIEKRAEAFLAQRIAKHAQPPQPTELLAARALVSNYHAPAQALHLDDIVRGLRASQEKGETPEYETMLAAQTHLTNAAFNRLMADGLGADDAGEDRIRIALQAQRSCAFTLNTLYKIQALEAKKQAKSGKQNEQPAGA